MLNRLLPQTPAHLPPGPRLPSPLQTLRYAFDLPRFFAECRSQFGRTWTMRLPGFPPIVVTGDREVIRRLFTGDPLVRRHGNDLFAPVLGTRSVMLLEPGEHLARRRLELPSFHGSAVRAHAERIAEVFRAEVSSWPPGEVVATHPRAREATMAIILELVLGVSDPDLRTELARIFDLLNSPVNSLGMFMPAAISRRAWWNLATRRAYSTVDRLRDLLQAHIVATRGDPMLAERTDVLALLLRARDENGATLSDEDLRDDLVTLVSAGHDTTATAIAWACDLMANHPVVVNRLRRSLAEGDREYLKATVKETLRARAVAPVAAGRRLLEPFAIGQWELTPDVVVLVDAQGVHTDPELYANPDAFEPERFLEEPPSGYAYLPFGGGAHRCLGAALATLELELFLTALVQMVDLAPASRPAEPVRRGATLAPGNRGRVRVLRLRSPSAGSRAARPTAVA